MRQIQLPTTQEFVIFAFQGRSFTTRPEQMVYLYRLAGHHDQWRQTRADQVKYQLADVAGAKRWGGLDDVCRGHLHL